MEDVPSEYDYIERNNRMWTVQGVYRVPKPENRNPEPGTSYPKPEIRNSKPTHYIRSQNTKTETQTPKPET